MSNYELISKFKTIMGRPDNKKDMVFCLIYTDKAQPYIGYEQMADGVPDTVNVPTVLLQFRWSGDIGFPGGNVDPEDKTLEDAVVRECLEEINYRIDKKKLFPLATFSDGKRNISSFTYKVTEAELLKVYSASCNAKHFRAENCGSIMAQLGSWSIPKTLKQNFSGTAGKELKLLINEVLKIKH